jgi:hypothetical protein
MPIGIKDEFSTFNFQLSILFIATDARKKNSVCQWLFIRVAGCSSYGNYLN